MMWILILQVNGFAGTKMMQLQQLCLYEDYEQRAPSVVVPSPPEAKRAGSRQRRKKPVQLGLEFSRWGGRRDGAGRKPRAKRRRVGHRRRRIAKWRHPLHITLRFCDGLPNLRRGGWDRVLRGCFQDSNGRFGLRIVHFSIQADHLHVIVEIEPGQSLTRAMKSLNIRVAKRVNRILRRVGPVLADRYHVHVLTTLREVVHAVHYVLANSVKHAAQQGIQLPANWHDPLSSVAGLGRTDAGYRSTAAVVPPRTWLLRRAMEVVSPRYFDSATAPLSEAKTG